MRRLLILVALLCGLAAPGFAQSVQTHTIVVNGVSRVFYTYRPAVTGNLPLVVAFHGGGQTALYFASQVGLRRMANKYHFILAMPQGINRSWNTDMIAPVGYADRNGVDDLGFVDAMLNDLVTSPGMGVDAHRIYAMGGSEGGMMAYDAACNLKGYFNAIGVVAATLSSGSCASSNGVSLLHIHGTNDQHVPFNGGSGQFSSPGANWFSAAQGINIFAQGNQCSAKWAASQLTSDTTCQVSSCSGGASGGTAEYCLVKGGGHGWPGVQSTQTMIDKGSYSTMTFNATDMIAQFFQKH